MTKMIEIKSLDNKKKKKIISACNEGVVQSYIKHPLTGEFIPVDQKFIVRMKAGESIPLQEILDSIN